MAGFFRVSFEGEFFNQKVVNVFHYRSDNWVPGGGNPFDDTLGALDDVIAKLETPYLDCMSTLYTLENVVGVGYDDAYEIVTPSPLIRNVHDAGHYSAGTTNGAAPCAILSLRCGAQTQINLAGHSLRNRGYLAVGPLDDSSVDNYGHLSTAFASNLDLLGQAVDDTIIGVNLLATLVPIRIHEKWTTILGKKVLLWRTYSDVLGYSTRRVASYRRSRQAEA